MIGPPLGQTGVNGANTSPSSRSSQIGNTSLVTSLDRMLKSEETERGRFHQGATFPGGYLAMAARDRHCYRRGQGGGYIFDILMMVSKLACGARG